MIDMGVPVVGGGEAGHSFGLFLEAMAPGENNIHRDQGLRPVLTNLAAKPRAHCTVRKYAVEIRRYRRFCFKAGYVVDKPSEQAMIHFIRDLTQ